MSNMFYEKDIFYLKRFEKVKLLLNKNNFNANIFNNKEEALKYFYDNITKQEIIAYGGSKTLNELNIIDTLKQQNYNLLDRNKPNLSKEEKTDIERKSFFADIYLASVNALSEEGALVNIDMWGNRTAAIEFGPKKVYLFVGRNKLERNLTDAMKRAKNAAVMNCIRFAKNTPCTTTSMCCNCSSNDRICSITSIIERSGIIGRINLLLINEDLGF